MKESIGSFLYKELKENKVLVFCAVLTTVLSFGFAVCNYSIGVDDTARNHYLYSTLPGSMIQQGRLLHVLVNLLFGTVDFIPFYNDILGAGLFCLSALLFCVLFRYVTDRKISILSCTVFCCVYISYSITNEKFIYQLDVVATMLSYCCTALALIYAYYFTVNRNVSCFLKSVLIMALGLGRYETFVFLYFCGVFSIFLLLILVNKEQTNIKILFLKGLQYAIVLICALVLYYGIVAIVQLATGQFGVFLRSNAWTALEISAYPQNFWLLTKMIGKQFLNFDYFPILEFVVFSGISLIIFTVLSVKKRDFLIFLCWLALFGGNFFIHYIHGSLMYRGAQTFCFFIGFVSLILAEQCLLKLKLKNMVIFFTICLVLVQAADMTRWFYNDYIRYKKDSFSVNVIANELITKHDMSKPVVFTNGWYSFAHGGYLHTHYMSGGQSNGNSALYWAAGCLSGDIEVLFEFFRLEGYDFLIMPTQEEIVLANEEAVNMPRYPYEGYIKETENMIVVNIGSFPS